MSKRAEQLRKSKEYRFAITYELGGNLEVICFRATIEQADLLAKFLERNNVKIEEFYPDGWEDFPGWTLEEIEETLARDEATKE